MPNHFKIIVPFYNVEDWIKICIRSIKAQSYTNFQCILIDDLSDDNTEEIVKKYFVFLSKRYRKLYPKNNSLN